MKRLPAALALIPVCVAGPGFVARLDAQSIADVRYDVVFNAETALRREIHVEMTFTVQAATPVSLSLPAWTPGAYELDDYARNVRGLWARQDGAAIRWDMADYDTWRVYPTGRGEITIGFDYLADVLDTDDAWSQPDFVYFNGTNVFLFPEAGGLSFESLVTFHTEPDWRVTTGLTALSTREYTAANYHELVDQPTFVGRFDLDSLQVEGRWYRLATYPEGMMAGASRSLFWDQLQGMVPPIEAVMDDVPYDRYTVLLAFNAEFGGGSALEHADSHLGVYHPTFLGSPVFAMITAHEIFHAWNVKRLRPADLWPYDYGRAMPTELLWISEGITDYYADIVLVRGGITSPEYFYQTTQDKMNEVLGVPPVALEDASLSAWVGPRDGTGDIYYSKGSLAGLMLDILIRDASDNRASLDDVFRTLYREDYLNGRGFTEQEWWTAVSEASGGRPFEDFHDAYVDGREPYPWRDLLPLSGLALQEDIQRTALMGIVTNQDDRGVHVVGVTAGGAADAAGVQRGDRLISVGDIAVSDGGFGLRFRDEYGDQRYGTPYDIVVERDGRRLTLRAALDFAESTTLRVVEDPTAGPKARRIRNGIFTGTVDR